MILLYDQRNSPKEIPFNRGILYPIIRYLDFMSLLNPYILESSGCSTPYWISHPREVVWILTL